MSEAQDQKPVPSLRLAHEEVATAARLLGQYAENSARDARAAEAAGDGSLAAAYLQAAADWRFRESCTVLGATVLAMVIEHEDAVRKTLRDCAAAAKRKAAKGQPARQGAA